MKKKRIKKIYCLECHTWMPKGHDCMIDRKRARTLEDRCKLHLAPNRKRLGTYGQGYGI